MRFLRDFEDERQRIGPADFAVMYGRAVLIGAGVIGAIQRSKSAPHATCLAVVLPTDRTAADVISRVWLLRKASGCHGGVEQVTAGRDSRNDIIIPEHSVSGRQAIFVCEGERTLLMDLNSRNGTYVNEQRLTTGKPHRLENGQRIRLGRLLCTFLTRQGFLERLGANFVSA